MFFSVESYFRGLGDWVFSPPCTVSLAGGSPNSATSWLWGGAAAIELTEALHELAPAFVTELADRLVALQPDVVGFTTTFQQNAASLALARAVKARNPAS